MRVRAGPENVSVQSEADSYPVRGCGFPARSAGALAQQPVRFAVDHEVRRHTFARQQHGAFAVLFYDGWLPGDGFGDQFLFGPSGSAQKTCKVARVAATKQRDEFGQSQRQLARACGEKRKMNSHSHTDCDCVFTPTKMETLSTPLLVVSWVCRIAAAVILLQTLYFKFTGAEESVYIFTKVGLEPWGRYASGVAELFAAALLLFPRTAWLGALIAAGVMVAAIGSHLTRLGIVVKDDGGLLFALAVIVFVAALVTLFVHRRQIPFVGNVFAPASANP